MGGGLNYLEAQAWRCDELSARRSMHFVASVQHERRQAWCCLWSGAHFREQRQAESSSLTMFALQESVCWSETYFREHDRADSFVACTCFYIAEDAEY